MKDRGLKPNSFTYAALLKGYSEQGGALDPERLQEYMRAFEAALQVPPHDYYYYY